MNVGMDDRRWPDSCGIKEVFGNRCNYGSGVEEFIRGLITVYIIGWEVLGHLLSEFEN